MQRTCTCHPLSPFRWHTRLASPAMSGFVTGLANTERRRAQQIAIRERNASTVPTPAPAPRKRRSRAKVKG